MLPTQPIAIAKYGKIFQKAKWNDIFYNNLHLWMNNFSFSTVLCIAIYYEYAICPVQGCNVVPSRVGRVSRRSHALFVQYF